MKQKHLPLDEREIIEDMLKENCNLSQIADKIGKHRTTISKEILNHRFKKDFFQYNTYFANCINTDNCENFKEKECILLSNPPYVCNGCSKKTTCRLSKYYYRAKDANNEYLSFRSESRQGIRISKDEIYEINNVITPLIKDKKQSINHVFINHPEASIVEMDTVEGIKGGKVFLTLLFRQYNFMFIFLMEHKTMEEVEKVFVNIRKLIGNDEFKRIF